MATTLLTKREAASRARVSERTLDRILSTDTSLPVTRIGRRVLIPETAFNEWLARQSAPLTRAKAHAEACQ